MELEGNLLKAVQSFYVNSRVCVRVGNDVNEWFPANVGSRQGCVMYPWLFNAYMDGVVRVLGWLECREWIVKKEEVRRRAGIEMKLASRADQRVLRWFGHVERMDDYRMARRVLMAEVSGGRVRGRPRLGWMDGVKVALGNRGMTMEAARKTGKSGEPWYVCN